MPNLRIFFVVTADLPQGGGNTTRLKSLANTLVELGHEVHILIEHSLGNTPKKYMQKRGNLNGFSFEYVTDLEAPKGVRFVTQKIKGVYKIIQKIRTEHKNKKIDVIWFNQLAFHDIFPISLLAKSLGIKTIQSYEDERMRGKGIRRKIILTNQYLADYLLSPWANAIVVISTYLQNKYEKATTGNTPIHLIPTIVDVDKFKTTSKTKNSCKRLKLMYMGSFFGLDNIELTIDMAKVLKEKNVEFDFYLLGDNLQNTQYMVDLRNKVEVLNLSDTIHFVGFVKFEELKEYLGKADLLIGIRKNDPWSSTGLSTKLSEYLSSGRPVLCSAVGDNLKYLTNNESAFIVPVDINAKELAESVNSILTNADLREKVGITGQIVANNFFDKKVVKSKMETLLKFK